MENNIIIVVPFYNVSKYIEQCYHSLTNQDYDNFRIIFMDDHSTDGSFDLIPETKKVAKYRSNKRNFALFNIYQALSMDIYSPNDIVTVIDGDDYLINKDVLRFVNEIYNKKDCLLTYGQYYTTTGHIGHCSAYSKDEFENLRVQDWKASQLRTFRYKLFQNFLIQDPLLEAYKDDNGEFYTMTSDVAFMYPLLEIAGYENTYFNDQILYIYRIHQLNDMHIDRQLQRNIEMQIHSKNPFKRMF